MNNWWMLSIADCLAKLNTDAAAGLNEQEANRRLGEYGPNELQAAHRVSPWTLLLQQFKNVLIIILLIATALSAFLGHEIEAIAIAVIVLLAVLLGFVQEYRANAAAEKLRQSVSVRALVMRDGKPLEIPATQVVPGDIVLLESTYGDRDHPPIEDMRGALGKVVTETRLVGSASVFPCAWVPGGRLRSAAARSNEAVGMM